MNATTAPTGTASTSSRRATSTVTSALIPGRSSPSSFPRRISTGNIVTFCSTTDCGSTLNTFPVNVRFGNDSTETFATCPARTVPTSVSSTFARTCISERSAILNSVVPPETFDVADAMIVPTSTVRSRIVPAIGARIVASFLRSFASSRFVCARTSSDFAPAAVSTATSYSCWVITPASRSVCSRCRWAPAVLAFTRAASRSATAWR